MDTTISPTPAWRSLIEPLVTGRGYRALTHHLLGLPLGVAYFTWFVTAIALGLGLAITLIGIPILTAVLASVRPLLGGERALANSLLDANVAPASLAPQAEGIWQRLVAYWKDGASRRGMAYLLLRSVTGVAAFTVAVSAYGTALTLIAAPLLAPLDALDMGFWEPSTVLEGLALVPAGVVLLIVSAWISEAMAAGSRALARWGAR